MMKVERWRMKVERWRKNVERWRKNVERWRIKVEGGFEVGRMNEQTFVIVESLSRLKSIDDASPLMTKVDLWLKSIDD